MHRQKYLDDLLCLNCAQMFNANINHQQQQLRNDENVREKFSYKVHRFFQRVLDVKTGLRDEKRFSPLARLATSLPVLPRVPRTKPKWGTSLPLMLSFMYLQLCSSNFGTSFNLFISTATFFYRTRLYEWFYKTPVKVLMNRCSKFKTSEAVECREMHE